MLNSKVLVAAVVCSFIASGCGLRTKTWEHRNPMSDKNLIATWPRTDPCADMNIPKDLFASGSMKGDAKANLLIQVLSNPAIEDAHVEACFVPNWSSTSDAEGPAPWIQGIYNMQQLMDIADLFFIRALTTASGEVFKQMCATQLKIINDHKAEAKCGNDGYWELGFLGFLGIHIPAKNVVWGSWMQQHPVGALAWCHDGSGIAYHQEEINGKALLDGTQQAHVQVFRQRLFDLMQNEMAKRSMSRRLKTWKRDRKSNVKSFFKDQLRQVQPIGYKVGRRYW